MFKSLFRKSTSSTSHSVRDTLFGDSPLDQWPADNKSDVFPWSAFVTARDLLKKKDKAGAAKLWQQIVDTPRLESRHYLQAWHFLRQNGHQPPVTTAKQLLGVVVEVGMSGGLDLLAAYPDHTARYYNYSGAGVVWDHPNASLDQAINALLIASSKVISKIGPWEKARPAAPPKGQMRLCFLTRSGLHFGQADMNTFAADPMAGPVVQSATALMQKLIALGDQKA